VARALLVIDVQRVYTDPKSELFCQGSSATLKNINRLIQSAQRSHSPVIYVRHIHKNDGSDLGRMFDYSGEAPTDFNFRDKSNEVEYDPRLLRVPHASEIRKTRYSAFVGTDLDRLLKRKRVNTVIICGFMTNFCCDSTARDAHDRDYFVDFIIDATGTPGTNGMDQTAIRHAVSEMHASGFSNVYRTSRYIATRRR